jgi:phosphoglycerate dehydrogenase-like enzyme
VQVQSFLDRQRKLSKPDCKGRRPSSIDQPFLDLPSVIASPHNSAQGGGAHDISLRRAVENCRRTLTGEAPLHVIGLDERLI